MARKMFTQEDAALPMNYPGFIFRTLREEGYCAMALLAGTGLTEELLSDPDHRFGLTALRRLILNAIEQTGDPHLGVTLALKFDPGFIGAAAYTMMNAPTFADSLEIASRYAFLTFPNIEFVLLPQSSAGETRETAIRLSPKLPLGDIAYFVGSASLISCNRLLKEVLRRPTVATRGDLRVSEPDGWAGVASNLGFPVRFNAQVDLLVFPSELLHQPLPGADPINHARLLAICEKFAAEAGFKTTLRSQVVSFLEANGNMGASLREAAASLGYSQRALRRHLEQSGTSYRKLVEEVRFSRAREMLTSTTKSIGAIAHELGYDSPSNFARSFKRSTGITPGALRESRRGPRNAGQD
ncbi:MAG: AraC family transcriptional regulator [Alphaproteobacteria bacterium]|nr:AraC family transcriptional regulator [Alphaproteobacteria bacterium]